MFIRGKDKINFHLWQKLVVANVLLVNGFCAAVAWAQSVLPDSANSQELRLKIENLTVEILRKEIQLERFNIRYRQEVAKQGRWKGWRYFISQEANASATNAGLIAAIDEHMDHIHHPQRVNTRTLQAALVPQIVGQIIGAGGAALEFGINGFHELRSRQLGFAPKTAKGFVMDISADIDQLLKQRQELVNRAQDISELSACAQVSNLEGQMLKDIRDLSLLEYARFYVDGRRTLAFQQSLYLLDMAKNVIGATGNGVAKHALHTHNRKHNGPSGVLTTISGALIVATPILSRGVGMAVGRYEKWRIKDITKNCDIKEVTQLDQDKTQLQQLCEANKDADDDVWEPSLARLALYETHNQSFLQQLELTTREVHAGNLAATENVLSGLFTGGTKMANGITLAIAGHDFHHSGPRTNDLIGAGLITYCVGTSWAMFDNIRIQVKREMVNHRLSKMQRLPGQVLKARLQQLEDMEALLDKVGKPRW